MSNPLIDVILNSMGELGHIIDDVIAESGNDIAKALLPATVDVRLANGLEISVALSADAAPVVTFKGKLGPGPSLKRAEGKWLLANGEPLSEAAHQAVVADLHKSMGWPYEPPPPAVVP